MLGKIEGRRKGQQRIRWQDGIAYLMNMNLSKIQELVKGKEAWNFLKLMSIDLLMSSNHLNLCHPLLLLLLIFPSIRVFSNESALCIRWSKYWSFSFNISPSNEHSDVAPFRSKITHCWYDPDKCTDVDILLVIMLMQGKLKFWS